MKKYRKKPVVIETVKFDYETWVYQRKDKYPMVDGTWTDEGMTAIDPHIQTLEGKMFVSDGDYIIKGVEGEYYPCKPAIFEKAYEPVGE